MTIRLYSQHSRQERLQKELERMVGKLKLIGVKKIILFGSLARGDIGSASDIDLVVIKNTDMRFLDRLEFLYSELEPAVAVDILCYRPDEIEEMSHWSSFIKRILEEGRVLYES